MPPRILSFPGMTQGGPQSFGTMGDAPVGSEAPQAIPPQPEATPVVSDSRVVYVQAPGVLTQIDGYARQLPWWAWLGLGIAAGYYGVPYATRFLPKFGG